MLYYSLFQEDFWITLAVFHRCLVALSIQLSEAENVIKPCITSQIVKPSPTFETEQQQEIGEEAVVRFEFKFYS